MAKKIRVGIIGVGGIAKGAHIPGYQRLEDVEIYALCDIIPERAQKQADKLGVKHVFTDYHEMLKMEEIDVISVCTPNDVHAPASIAALEAGKDVICEKPMAKTAAEAMAMVEAARRTGRILTVGYQWRFEPRMQVLKKKIQAGDLGEIYYARAIALRQRGIPAWGSFLSMEKQGGGPLIDIGTHALDLTLYLMGHPKPRAVLGSSYTKLAKTPGLHNPGHPFKPEEYEVEDAAFGLVKLADGSTISVESAWAINITSPEIFGTVLVGDQGGAEFLYPESVLKTVSEDIGAMRNSQILVPNPPVGAHAMQFEHFIAAVRREKEVMVKPEEGLVACQIQDAIYQSAQTGDVVKIG